MHDIYVLKLSTEDTHPINKYHRLVMDYYDEYGLHTIDFVDFSYPILVIKEDKNDSAKINSFISILTNNGFDVNIIDRDSIMNMLKYIGDSAWIKPDDKHMPKPFEHVLLKIEESGHAIAGEWNDISNTWKLVYGTDISPEYERDEVIGWMPMPDWFEW